MADCETMTHVKNPCQKFTLETDSYKILASIAAATMTQLAAHPQSKILRLQLRQNLVLQHLSAAQWLEFESLLEISDYAKGDGVVKFGGILPLTGSLAFLSPPEIAGAELAVADINAAGGVLGQPVTWTVEESSDGDHPEVAPASATKVLGSNGEDTVGSISSSLKCSSAAVLASSAKRSGISSVNVLPSPSLLSALNLPPSRDASREAMASPSPAPP